MTLQALADWYEEQDDANGARCLRWLARNGKWPYQHRHNDDLIHHHDTWRDGWYWWTTDREKRGWGYPASAKIPHALWGQLSHTFNYDPLVFKEYPSVRAAVEALIAVWEPGLVEERKVRAPRKKAP